MTRFAITLLTAALVTLAASASSAADDAPPAQPGSHAITTLEHGWVDNDRDGRKVPAKIHLPRDREAAGPAPVIIFSHGLGGTRHGYTYLGQFLASHGYAVVHLQHAGSDDRIWRNVPAQDRASHSRAARSPAAALARAGDVPFAIDQLVEDNTNPDTPLHQRLDVQRIGMAGHSYGAWSSLVAGGQSLNGQGEHATRFRDERIRAIVPLSAPVPRTAALRQHAFSSIAVPALHITGTRDHSPVAQTTAKDRRIPFDLTKPQQQGGPPAWLIIFDGADHMTFAGPRPRNARRPKTDPAQHLLIQRATLAFFNAHLRDDARATRWFKTDGLKQMVGDQGRVEAK